MMSLSKSEAVSSFLDAQGFLPERTNEQLNPNLKKCMQKIKLLQLDAVPIVIRAQYMPFFSRLGIYSIESLDVLAYEKNHWFECWAHEASLLPIELEPLFRWNKARAMQGQTWKSLYQFACAEKNM